VVGFGGGGGGVGVGVGGGGGAWCGWGAPPPPPPPPLPPPPPPAKYVSKRPLSGRIVALWTFNAAGGVGSARTAVVIADGYVCGVP
jgi:hypothetical protein